MSLYINRRCVECGALESAGGLRVGGPDPFCERCVPDMFPKIGEDLAGAKARERRADRRISQLRKRHTLSVRRETSESETKNV